MVPAVLAVLTVLLLALVGIGDALPPKLVITGLPVIVWNQTADACPGKNKYGHIGEQPDSMPTAWHDPLTNMSSVISATDWGTYASKGNTLDHVTHDCSHKTFTEVNSSFPSSYTNHQWLQATRMNPDGTGQAIIHNEFHGEQSGNLSYCSFNHKTSTGQCILWSTDLGHTTDGGNTWTTTHAPVFSLPRKYKKDYPIAGYGALGSVLRFEGAWYGHVYRSYHNNTGAGPPNTVGAGMCAYRTSNLSDPTAFRLWNGTTYGTRSVDPYSVPPIPPSKIIDHTCASIDVGYDVAHLNPKTFAPSWRPKDWPSHVLLGWPIDKTNTVAYSFPPATGVKPDRPFVDWGTPQYLDLSGWLDPHTIGGLGPLMYPTLLDHDSPFGLSAGSGDPGTVADGLSYGLVGNSSLFVYLVFHRSYIVRVPVAWVDADAPVPPPPFPPSPLNPANCSTIRVTGAGLAGVDGDYTNTGTGYLYEKDATHQLYCEQASPKSDCFWRLAHKGVPPVYYTGQGTPAGEPRVPVTGWGGDVMPYPTTVCAQ